MFSNRNRRNHRRGSISVMVLIAAAALFVVGSTSAYAMGTDGASTTNPWIQSDQADYAPGSTVTLTGGNWQPGESVHVFVDDTNGHTWNHSADVTADDMGLIQDVFNLPNAWVSDYDVTATGASSGTAATAFTDSQPQTPTSTSTTVTVAPGGTADYGTVSVPFNGNANSCTVTLGTSGVLPAGASAVFGTASLTSTGTTQSTSFKITTSGTTPAGTSTFQITATRGLNCQGSGAESSTNMTLIVSGKADQTITFGALGNKTFGDAVFTVSATGGGSGNPVTFSVGATDNCTSSGTTGATITITGAGSCTVTANQAGNGNYNDAPSFSRTFSIGKASQSITVTTPAPASAVYNSSFSVAATGGASGNPVTFSSGGS